MQQLAVINPLYCAAMPTTLVLKNVSWWDIYFTAYDTQGRLWFTVDRKFFSLSDKRKLLDARGQVVCNLTKELFSLNNTWNLFRGASTDDAQKIATIEPELMTLTPTTRIYLRGGDRTPNFVAKGYFLAEEFYVFQRVGGQERPIGKCRKQSICESISKAGFGDTYYLDVLPGVDAAFIVALSVCLHEVYRHKD